MALANSYIFIHRAILTFFFPTDESTPTSVIPGFAVFKFQIKISHYLVSKSTTVVTNYLLTVYNLFGVEQEVNSEFIRVMTQNIKVAGHNAEKNKLRDNKILV